MNWQKLQIEVGKWSLKNFGEQPAERRILGMIEELGELVHAILKQEQNIRDTSMQDEWDAIGDLVIYILDYCYILELDIENIVDSLIPCDIDAPINQQIFNIANALSLLPDNPARRRHILGCILNHLKNICMSRENNFESCIESTWYRVQQRDWKLYPHDGETK